MKDRKFVFDDTKYNINACDDYEDIVYDSDNETADELTFDITEDNINTKIADKNIHDDHRKRMYERFFKTGLEGFSDHEVLEMILFHAIPRGDTNKLAHELLKIFGNSIQNVLEADIRSLMTVKGIGQRAAISIVFFERLKKYLDKKNVKKKIFYTSQDIGIYCISKFGFEKVECLHLLSLDKSRRLIAINTVSRGDEFETKCPIQEIIRYALMNNAKYVILCHNHPCSSLNPSSSDINSTDDVHYVMEVLGIPLIDHIICNENSYTSFAERSLFSSRQYK